MAKKRKTITRDVIVVDPFTVQFCALSIILLAFFILLNSMATIDDQKKRLVIGSLIGTFGQVPGAHEDPTEGIMDNPSIESSAAGLSAIARRLRTMVESEGLHGSVSVFQRGNDLVLQIACDEVFRPETDIYNRVGEAIIEGVAKIVAPFSCDIEITGHTDQVSIYDSRFETAWLFAASRSARVFDTMLQLGIDHQRMMVASRGCVDQIRPNEHENQRAANRRIEVILIDGVFDPHLGSSGFEEDEPTSIEIQGIEVEHPNGRMP